LGVVYFLFSALLDVRAPPRLSCLLLVGSFLPCLCKRRVPRQVASNTSNTSEQSVPLRLVFIFPVVALDATFYAWIFSGLTHTLSELSTRRQTAKLRLYQRFSYVLAVSIVVSGLWACFQMLVIVRDNLDEHWASLWVLDAGWHVLHLAILVAVCLLWAPGTASAQFAGMDELPPDSELAREPRG